MTLNAARIPRDLIVIGASAGGVQVLIELFGMLRPGLAAAVVVVLHRSPHYGTRLDRVLGRRTRLRIKEAEHGESIRSGHIYLAPRDEHVLVDGDVLALSRGPKENRARPAVDPLFDSAARSRGRGVVGVVLTGLGGDGVRGMIAIKAGGGVTIVQDPAEAPYASMPIRAIAGDHVDASLPLASLGPTLVRLAAGDAVALPDGAPTPGAVAPGDAS